MAAYPAIAPNLGYIMNISLSERAYDRSKGNYWKDAGICSPKMLTIPAQNVKTGLQLDSFDNGGDFDMFDVYTCDVGPNTTLLDARYNINIRANGSSSSLDGMVLPQIWLNIGTPDELLPHYNVSYMHGITPWLVPSWQLAAGIHSIAEMSMAKRKFIESPFLRDTLGGMKPVSRSYDSTDSEAGTKQVNQYYLTYEPRVLIPLMDRYDSREIAQYVISKRHNNSIEPNPVLLL
ncbi:hypothetical protein FRC09_020853 [Ceratobasidium sp. 395]|nr:hypothetical protein FRC09_020853 [Ceratobasidium sp. 395]